LLSQPKGLFTKSLKKKLCMKKELPGVPNPKADIDYKPEIFTVVET
jgi:hypothetical protein